MHSRAVEVLQTALCRTNRTKLIPPLAATPNKTRSKFPLSRASPRTTMENIGPSLADIRSLSTNATREVDTHLSERDLAGPSKQTIDISGRAGTPSNANTGLLGTGPEQLSGRASFFGRTLPDDGLNDSPTISQNMTQLRESIPEPSDTDKYYGPVDLSFKPIPPLPPPVSGWPTPWAEKTEIEKYLLPLYGRGWGIRFKLNKLKVHANASKDDQPKAKITGPQRSTAYLVVEYEFDDYQCAADFVKSVATIATTEDHHPRTLAIIHAAKPTVSLTVHTDSAKRPMWDQPLRRKLAGITLRDLRFAILVETLYSDSYGRDRDHKRLIRPLEHRPQWPKYLRILRKNSLDKPTSPPESPIFSPEEVEGSQLEDAPREDTVSIQKVAPVCGTCGMNHRSEICPLNRPLSECVNCGGDHWLVDCPQSQLDKASKQPN